MSNRWPGGIIRKTPVTPAGPFQNGAAPGMWTLAEASYWTKQGVWPIAGNEQLFVEDVFSTWLYTGNSSTQTITNGIDLAGKGGLVWIKSRSNAVTHNLQDTVRGANIIISSNSTAAQYDGGPAGVNFSFNSSGFSQNNAFTDFNATGVTYASWTFREAPKFFDIVTYTGTGSDNTLSQNLGVAPGCIIIKRTDTSGDWWVYHRSTPNYSLKLNSTAAQVNQGGLVATSTTFTLYDNANVNASGGTYVAYLYAHDTASDGIIQCGSYTGNGSATGPVVTLGWEPQWVMIKAASTTGGWQMLDAMRGMPVGSADSRLTANTSDAEDLSTQLSPTATGFQLDTFGAPNESGQTYIYIAIRRGPMKTPTLGTSVFSPNVSSASTGTTITTNFPVDLQFAALRSGGSSPFVMDRLRGVVTSGTAATMPYLNTGSTAAETLGNSSLYWDNTGYQMPSGFASNSDVFWNFRRAPGFFDEVCWTGNAAASQSISHNLGVVPELIITKRRPAAEAWQVYSATTGASAYLNLNTTAAVVTGNTNRWNATAPTATIFTVGSAFQTSDTYVTYLFASAPGVSKVGSYTGTGTTQTIDCGFTTGARFVLIKRTDSTGDWYVWDSARGIVAGNDPYLLLNSTAAEVTSTDYVDTDNSGFQLSSTAPAGINASGGTYIFLAIA